MSRFSRWGVLVIGLGVSLTSFAHADHYVVCESSNDRRTYCDVRDAYDADIRISRQLSNSSCIEDVSWGRDRRGIWVDDGCRAEFAVESRDRRDRSYDDYRDDRSRTRDRIDEARDERYELEREVERNRELRAQIERERVQQQSAAVEHCPQGFVPGNYRCTNEDRRRGCKDMRMPGGTTCNSRGWNR